MSIGLVEFASALAANAPPGPSGRSFIVWAWGADTRDPDALVMLKSATGHPLATAKITAAEWRSYGEEGRARLVVACLGNLVAAAIKPTHGRLMVFDCFDPPRITIH